ncbi:immunity 49 family protein [Streptomyces virginiae]|uniref:immunity 49 family protein n=1 Tax=Streptomyces virginiae TaxID=1961 RepID=UPI002DDAB6A8|nr:immunity 49 family protein [Streptomyces virginiae]WSC81072.1 immunity 49 family protein [Streptomyces virginiae]
MRIERHRVSEAALVGVREDFANRMISDVYSRSRGGRIDAYAWWEITLQFLDGLGAFSAVTPDLDTPEARAILDDAAEAAAGAVSFAAYYPNAYFHVFLTYVDLGLDYDADPDGSPQPVSAARWIDAFCLAVLADKVERHGEAFHFARRAPQRAGGPGLPSVELINGLLAYVSGDLGDDEQKFPPSPQQTLAALDAALGRVADRRAGARAAAAEPVTAEIAEAADPATGALRALRALAARDREAFGVELTALLLPYSDLRDPRAEPRTLLPLLPLALAALGHRREGWRPPVESGYLPRALVTGFETSAPRVGPYGRERRADAVAALAAGPLVVERPDMPEAAGHAEYLVRELYEAVRTGGGAAGSVRSDRPLGPGYWYEAVKRALITGNRAELAPLVLSGPGALEADRSAFASYRQALHDYLRGEDPEPATDRAVADVKQIREWGFAPSPAVLFSQLVEGDEESFNLALADALEAHRDHHSVGDRLVGAGADAAVDFDILALACHARRRGWRIRVSSAYLPEILLGAAQPF